MSLSAFSFTVEKPARLLAFLEQAAPQFSRQALRKAILAGGLQLLSRPSIKVDPGTALLPQDRLLLHLAETPQAMILPEPGPLEILFEDAHLLVLNKPSGVLVHPTSRERSGTLANWLLAYSLGHWRPTFPHRLDRETSGLLLVAKSGAGSGRLGLQFQGRTVAKRYLALLSGQLSAPLEVHAPIDRVAGRTPPWGVTPGGKPSHSSLRPLTPPIATQPLGPQPSDASPSDTNPSDTLAGHPAAPPSFCTLAELIPHTGRTNQLRIHAAHAGLPICGDRLYGPIHPSARTNPASRLCLHAWQLTFQHPRTGQTLHWQAPLPDGFLPPDFGPLPPSLAEALSS